MSTRSLPLALVATLVFSVSALPAFAAPAKKGVSKTAPAPGAPAAEKKTETPADQTASESRPEMTTARLVDLNFALKSDFLALPGIDEEIADKIIAGRPYKTKSQLRQKNIMPPATFYGVLEMINIDVAKLDKQEKAAREKELRAKQRQQELEAREKKQQEQEAKK